MPRFFIMVGEQDDAAAGSRKSARALEDAGFDVTLKVYTGVGHSFPRNRDAALDAALHFVLRVDDEKGSNSE
jgi:acetyl esterase/lipase